MSQPEESRGERPTIPARRGLSDPAKIAIGIVLILAWGLFFDQLTRVGGWVLDTYNTTTVPPLRDLHSWYVDAGIALHGGHLYGFRNGAFTYPPIGAYLFVPFRVIGFHATAILWTVGNVILLAVLFTITLWKFFGIKGPTAWLASAAGLAPAAIFVFYPFHSLLYWGQLSLVLVVVAFVDLFLVPTRFRGVLIGVVTAIKLLPVVFVIWLVARREFGGVLRLVATFAVLTLAAAAVWPHASAQFWFHILPSGKDVLVIVNAINLPTHGHWYFGVGRVANQSLRGMLGRPPFLLPGTFPWVVLALLMLAAGALVTVWILRQWRERDLLAFVVLWLTTILISPVSWVHYWVLVGLLPFVVLLEWRRDRVLAIASGALAVATCINLEDPRLSGPLGLGAHFSLINPAELFVLRNFYVLAGVAFLAIVAWRTAPPRGVGLLVVDEGAIAP